MTIDNVCEILTENGIGFKRENVNGLEMVYIHHGGFGHPDGLKIKKGEFRPDFRITIHDGGRIYTKVCGYTSYMNMNEVLRTIKNW